MAFFHKLTAKTLSVDQKFSHVIDSEASEGYVRCTN